MHVAEEEHHRDLQVLREVDVIRAVVVLVRTAELGETFARRQRLGDLDQAVVVLRAPTRRRDQQLVGCIATDASDLRTSKVARCGGVVPRAANPATPAGSRRLPRRRRTARRASEGPDPLVRELETSWESARTATLCRGSSAWSSYPQPLPSVRGSAAWSSYPLPEGGEVLAQKPTVIQYTKKERISVDTPRRGL